MVRLVPGTVVEQLLGQAAIASPEVVASFRAYFGLDRPVHVQYAGWLAGVAVGPGIVLVPLRTPTPASRSSCATRSDVSPLLVGNPIHA